jgi:hypothetical protein
MPVKWAAELAHVREVSLLGTADAAFWKDRLRNEELLPAEKDGQAQVLISAADSKFLGVPFRELSFCVLVSPLEGGTQDAAFLLRAFNSSRFFAFCERALFSTPYYHADVRVSAFPASMQLVQKREVVFRAEMEPEGCAAGREPSAQGEDGWEGPVFLPQNRRTEPGQGKLFFARLQGHTRRYPFQPSGDSLVIRPSPDSEVLQALLGSQFVPTEWLIREDAAHAKSKTYKRTEGLQRMRESE